MRPRRLKVLRVVQLCLIGFLLLLPVIAFAAFERSAGEEIFTLALITIAGTLVSIHRDCRELPSLSLLGSLALVGSLVSFFLVPNLIRCRLRQGRLAGCQSNIRNLATSLEMYSTDNAGHYPKSLTQLTPTYLKYIPRCPSACRDTYSHGYERAQEPDAYTVMCEGCHHHDGGIDTPNFPRYTSFGSGMLP